MHIGVLILGPLYFLLGTFVGVAIQTVCTTGVREFIQQPLFTLGFIIAEGLAFFCWTCLRAKSLGEQPMRTVESPLEVVRGVGLTTRLWFLLLTSLWVMGLVFGIVVGLG